MAADRLAASGRGRDHRGRFVLLALALFTCAAVWATWPASRNVDGAHYLALPAAGHGQAAAGDHLQLGWSFWLAGHQLEHGRAPWTDPYSFRPEAEASPNLLGWLLGVPFWPLRHLVGNVWAYNIVVLLSFPAAGGLMTWWLRALGLGRVAALAGGIVFALAPYRVGQSTGHLLGLIAFLLPGMLLGLERRRFLLAAAALVAVPLSGQVHLAMGAVPLALGYVWARVPREDWPRAAAGPAAAVAAGIVVQLTIIRGSIAGGGRGWGQVERYSAELSDFFARRIGRDVEELVFSGWLVPVLALAGIVVAWRVARGLGVLLALAWLIPAALALGSNNPLYRPLWLAVWPLRFARVPERLMPIACLALAALVAFAVHRALASVLAGRSRAVAAAAAVAVPALLVADLRVPVFGAVAADEPSRAYAALAGDGRLLELPVIRPAVHYGSVYLGYARQSPRERPQGYSTVAPRAADRAALELQSLSCGRGTVPAELGIRYVVVHRGVYRQSGLFGAGCPAAAERMLERTGWRRLAWDGVIATWSRARP